VNMSDTKIFLEVEFASGFAFEKVFLKPYELNYELRNDSLKRSPFLSNKNTHLFHVPTKLFLSLADCWNVLAYREGNVRFDKHMSDNKRPFGWVTIHSATDYFYI